MDLVQRRRNVPAGGKCLEVFQVEQPGLVEPPMQGFGIRWSGRFLPTQTTPGFHTDKIPVPSVRALLFSIIPEQQGLAPHSLFGMLDAAFPARRAGSGGGTSGKIKAQQDRSHWPCSHCSSLIKALGAHK